MRKHRYEYQGFSLTLKGWACRLGVDYRILRRRLDDGWTIERTLSTRAHTDEQREVKERQPDATGRRAVKRLEYGGESLTVKEWSLRTGVPVPTINCRLGHGRAMAEVLGFKRIDKRRSRLKPIRLYEYEGESQSAAAWARILGMTQQGFMDRVHRGLSGAQLFAPVVRKRKLKKKVRKVSKKTRLRNFRKGLRFLPLAVGLR